MSRELLNQQIEEVLSYESDEELYDELADTDFSILSEQEPR